MSIMSEPSSQISPSLQLLILLSRLELSKLQEEAALTLCQRIDDWSEVLHQAKQRFVLPLVYRHLHRLAPEALEQKQLETMKCECMEVVQYNLWAISSQRNLVRELLEPLAVPYVFFKGYSLAARYYDEPAIRLCRDIDVLVPHGRIVDLLKSALERGYTSYLPKGLTTEQAGLEFAAETHKVVSLMTPQGVLVEFHQQIDKCGTIYDSDELLANTEVLRVGDVNINVMPTEELFVYICLHNSRHYWSNLHWLVDLDAIQRHPDFDPKAVRDCAARRHLTATVEASLEFCQAMASPEPWHSAHLVSKRSKEMLEVCLTTLQRDRDVEAELSRKRASPDFAFAWQASMAHRMRGRAYAMTKLFRPTYDDYHLWPLPFRWQWLYRFTCPFQKTYTRITTGKWIK